MSTTTTLIDGKGVWESWIAIHNSDWSGTVELVHRSGRELDGRSRELGRYHLPGRVVQALGLAILAGRWPAVFDRVTAILTEEFKDLLEAPPRSTGGAEGGS